MDVSPNHKLIVTAGQDRLAKLWHANTGELVGALRGHKRGVWAAKFSPVDQVGDVCTPLKFFSLYVLMHTHTHTHKNTHTHTKTHTHTLHTTRIHHATIRTGQTNHSFEWWDNWTATVANHYYEWAVRDPMVIGINPW